MQEVKVPVPPKRFILTKWYVNNYKTGDEALKFYRFILTKWYVNRLVSVEVPGESEGFILTKWYVN